MSKVFLLPELPTWLGKVLSFQYIQISGEGLSAKGNNGEFRFFEQKNCIAM